MAYSWVRLAEVMPELALLPYFHQCEEEGWGWVPERRRQQQLFREEEEELRGRLLLLLSLGSLSASPALLGSFPAEEEELRERSRQFLISAR